MCVLCINIYIYMNDERFGLRCCNGSISRFMGECRNDACSIFMFTGGYAIGHHKTIGVLC